MFHGVQHPSVQAFHGDWLSLPRGSSTLQEERQQFECNFDCNKLTLTESGVGQREKKNVLFQ